MAEHQDSSDYSPREDDQRMVRLQEGDAQAFAEIVAVWQDPLLRFFLRSTRDPVFSEDLVQETLLRLYRTSWDYIPQGLFRGFLFRIARNLLIDQSRRRVSDLLLRSVRRPERLDGDVDWMAQFPGTSRSAESAAEDREVDALVREFLADFPEEQRVTFTLYHYESLTLPEIADATNAGLSTTKSRLRLAREKLRELLTARGFGEGWRESHENS
ncbi:MAG: Sigma-W factor [Planctomycetota bacterium]|jgi:RNA polymerase sigma-70 factor (ECF subfamily)